MERVGMRSYVMNGGDVVKGGCRLNVMEMFGEGGKCWCRMGGGIGVEMGKKLGGVGEVDGKEGGGGEEGVGGMWYGFEERKGVWGGKV